MEHSWRGENAAVDRLIEEAAVCGARKTVKLRVSGAFHSPLVARAADRLRPALARAMPVPSAIIQPDLKRSRMSVSSLGLLKNFVI